MKILVCLFFSLFLGVVAFAAEEDCCGNDASAVTASGEAEAGQKECPESPATDVALVARTAVDKVIADNGTSGSNNESGN